ncbi:helix-turn-helix domain-containing protein [Lentzea albidocapillata]|uniref:Helix-turn-helix domain-containing protein n=1 Tax=Lentzea albidocapillata TaxID=40571 RepID=A0A1W2DJF5_9PSEU|nr:helix-turn-helix transcriptional regulator [Lentzea albidocapillata]SMC97212.1 Helix-turn-helix domain-containing protein [Lentzea albidocapillata]
MPNEPIGPRLRALRQASGRTVASVAADAGLSVPYIANLENGRGNPTTNALGRLASALGTELSIGFSSDQPVTTGPAPQSVVKLSRSKRFRATAAALAEKSGQDPHDVAARLISACVLLTEVLGHEASEHDWWRVLDALVLMAEHPA